MARKRRKRRRKRRIRWKAVLRLLGTVTTLVLLCYLFVVLFETRKINVTGNQYSSAQEVLDWVKSDKRSSNTLYFLWKYNKENLKQPPAIEKTSVQLKSPWEVTVRVTEKTFSGRVDFNGEFLYFDKDGIASLKSSEMIERVPYIEGMELNLEKVRLGKTLPVTEKEVFDRISSLTELLKKTELKPDKISCENRDLTMHFGGIRVQIGSSEYAEKLAHVTPILVKLQELYPGQTGVLHLENYAASDTSIRFVPDAVKSPEDTAIE